MFINFKNLNAIDIKESILVCDFNVDRISSVSLTF